MISDKVLLTSSGSYLPNNICSNDELSKFIDTSDEWISKRSGIKNRHFVSKNETTSDLALQAALKAIENSTLDKDDINLIIVATTTPDNTFPSTATMVQKKLNIKGAAFDIQAVCAGFVFALSVAKSLMKDNNYRNCLVIGADSMSKLLDWKDRSTAVLFGDGAGAVILENKENIDNILDDWGILSNVIHSDGEYYDLLKTRNIFIQLFWIDQIVVNITEHSLVPEHEIISQAEKEQLLEKYNIKSFSNLPIILKNEPVAKYFGMRRGDVCKITRSSETSGIYISYRSCQ